MHNENPVKGTEQSAWIGLIKVLYEISCLWRFDSHILGMQCHSPIIRVLLWSYCIISESLAIADSIDQRSGRNILSSSVYGIFIENC